MAVLKVGNFTPANFKILNRYIGLEFKFYYCYNLGLLCIAFTKPIFCLIS